MYWNDIYSYLSCVFDFNYKPENYKFKRDFKLYVFSNELINLIDDDLSIYKYSTPESLDHNVYFVDYLRCIGGLDRLEKLNHSNTRIVEFSYSLENISLLEKYGFTHFTLVGKGGYRDNDEKTKCSDSSSFPDGDSDKIIKRVTQNKMIGLATRDTLETTLSKIKAFKSLQYRCIHLQGLYDRKECVDESMVSVGLPIKYVDAVKGSDINIYDTEKPFIKLVQYTTELYLHDTRLRPLKMSYGEFGCALSHLRLYTEIVNSEFETYVIFEDDCKFTSSISCVVNSKNRVDKPNEKIGDNDTRVNNINDNSNNEQIAKIPASKETIAGIYYNYIYNLPPSSEYDVCLLSDCITFFPPKLVERINPQYYTVFRKSFNMTNAYIITKRGASKLLKLLECYAVNRSQSEQPTKTLFVNIPSDNLISNAFVNKAIDVISPSIRFFSTAGFKSAIWNIYKENETCKTVTWDKPITRYKTISMNNIGGYARLGNQMFQYAVLKALSIKYNRYITFPSSRTRLHLAFDLQFTNTDKRLTAPNCAKYEETIFSYDDRIHTLACNDDILNLDLNGYFQTELYFKEYEKEIKNSFTFKRDIYTQSSLYVENLKKKLGVDYLVSIHVRRGDLFNNYEPTTTTIITVECIDNCIKYFQDKLGKDKVGFLAFSDSIDWCKDNIKTNSVSNNKSENHFLNRNKKERENPTLSFNQRKEDSIVKEKIEFSETKEDYEDMCVMSLCDHNIISSSTFGWWGAYLNKNRDKTVICTVPWFNPDCLRLRNHDTKDIYPKEWIKYDLNTNVFLSE